MIRKIITIDEDLCDGCGNCVIGCSEGALQIIDGKAKLVKEDFCDGFGDCIGACPTGALKIEEKEVPAFDEAGVRQHLLQTQGAEAVWRMEEAQKKHKISAAEEKMHLGCPGARQRIVEQPDREARVQEDSADSGATSELAHWPVQLHLVRPGAPFFRDRELVVMSTCGPLAVADVHSRYLRGRSVVVGCPKLDDTRPYAQKLAAIFSEVSIPKVIVVRMEVPCCGGLTMIVEQAVASSGRSDLIVEEHILSVEGKLKEVKTI
ncbi:MAG: 4Fe-4S ferredoxin [Calditrichaeota bacterium]|nr:4Fe-4S ferredoxin [Calditrichota bacterium]